MKNYKLKLGMGIKNLHIKVKSYKIFLSVLTILSFQFLFNCSFVEDCSEGREHGGKPCKHSRVNVKIITDATDEAAKIQVNVFRGSILMDEKQVPIPGGGNGYKSTEVLFELKPSTYTISAMLLDIHGNPSAVCSSAQTTAEVIANSTTSVILILFCKDTPPGSLDDIVPTGDSPVITGLIISPGKSITTCQSARIQVKAKDKNGGALTYLWQVIDAPQNAIYKIFSNKSEARFATETPGNYKVQVGVSNSLGKTTSVTISLRVSQGQIAACMADDHDGDGIPDIIDNCPTVSNPKQIDTNGDGIGDVCDCEKEKVETYITKCIEKCQANGINNCEQICENNRGGFNQFAQKMCTNKEEEPKDSDNDGIPDDRDKCPDTPIGTQIDQYGCPIEDICHEGNCGASTPTCNGTECDNQQEVEVPEVLPPEILLDMGLNVFKVRPHPTLCPGDITPPNAPKIILPSDVITRIQLNASAGTSVTLKNNQVIDGDSVNLDFSWLNVIDSCQPIKYSVYIEYYHCHKVGNLKELATYLNRGWCRWRPYSYETIDNTQMRVNLQIGKILYEMHVPFLKELGWSPPAVGNFVVWYQPQWIRARVYAHDGNGIPSSVSGYSHYYVLFTGPIAYNRLSQLPITPN
jgi:hypothetical protein